MAGLLLIINKALVVNRLMPTSKALCIRSNSLSRNLSLVYVSQNIDNKQ